MLSQLAQAGASAQFAQMGASGSISCDSLNNCEMNAGANIGGIGASATLNTGFANAAAMEAYYFGTAAGRATIEAAWKTTAGRAKVITMRRAQQARMVARKAAMKSKKTAMTVSKKMMSKFNTSFMYNYYFETLEGKAWIEAAWKTKAGKAKVIAMRKAQQAAIAAKKAGKGAFQVAKKALETSDDKFNYYFNTAAGRLEIEAAWKTTAGRAKVIAMRRSQQALIAAKKAFKKATGMTIKSLKKAYNTNRLAMFDFYFNTAEGKIQIEAAWKTAEGRALVIAMKRKQEAMIAARAAWKAGKISVASAKMAAKKAAAAAKKAYRVRSMIMYDYYFNTVEGKAKIEAAWKTTKGRAAAIRLRRMKNDRRIEANLETPIIDINASVGVPNAVPSFIPAPKASVIVTDTLENKPYYVQNWT